MPAKLIEVPQLGVVKMYKRRGVRTIRLSISSKGDVRVTLPFWLPYSAGTTFAVSQQGWIASQRQSHHTELTHRQTIGQQHTLHFVADITSSKPTARLSTSIIKIVHPTSLSASDVSVQTVARKACVRALRAQAETMLPIRLAHLADQHGFSYRSVTIKQLTGRWGSCDAARNIVFNLYLMQLPQTLIDYVIMHELTHTRILRHGPDFWGEMYQYMPDVTVRRAAIRRYRPVVGAMQYQSADMM